MRTNVAKNETAKIGTEALSWLRKKIEEKKNVRKIEIGIIQTEAGIGTNRKDGIEIQDILVRAVLVTENGIGKSKRQGNIDI